MRNYTLSFAIAFCFTASSLSSQDCLTTQVNLNTQANVNAFVSMYAGTGCTGLGGGLYIGGTSSASPSNINDLTGLSFLTYVARLDAANFTIAHNPSLSDLKGLQNIEEIGAGSYGGSGNDLIIRNNDALTYIEYLTSLNSVAGTTIIEGNQNLVNFIGMGNGNTSLTIQDNPNITSLTGLLDNSIQRLKIVNNDKLVNLTGLELITQMTFNAEILIEDNDKLTSLFGLHNLVTFGSNANANNFVINNNLVLKNLYLTSLLNVNDYVPTNGINRIFQISNNPALINLSHLSGLNNVGNRLIISQNDSLQNLVGLEGIEELVKLEITGNDLLQDFTGLNNLENVASDLFIQSNESLSNLSGLDKLETVGGLFKINTNGISSIDGLSNFNQHLGAIEIRFNPNLTDINAIEEVNFIGGDLTISNNVILEECCILKLFLEGTNGIDGVMTIANNAILCKSLSDVYSCNEDGVNSTIDNCPDMLNPLQLDGDNDGIGDACDNCPLTSNANQLDMDGNGIGDVCELISGGAAGKVGVGTTDPKSKLHVEDGDVYIENIHRGIIVRSKGGKCFRLQPNESGQLTSTEINCPN